MRTLAAAILAASLGLASGEAQDTRVAALTDLFTRAKAQFRGGGYEASLATLQKLDEQSREPGLEAAREKLAPAMAFYRGADLAALGRKAEAKKEFETYLVSAPATRLDPSMYPKAVLQIFDEARDAMSSAGASPPVSDTGLAEAYARFRPSPSASDAAVDEKWADGPVRFLMTKSERAEWQRLSDAAARAGFVTVFWQRRDTTPETPENEFRTEFERRVVFADSRFAQGEKGGSETDRGMVFVLMGPPSYVGSALLKIEDDPIQAARSAPRPQVVAGSTGRVGTLMVTPQPMTAEKIQGSREIWHYRRDRLPPAVAMNEVAFEFLTKEGYGTGVLQRDGTALTTLEVAAGAGRPAPASPQ